jgi:hypothetical protein
MPFMIGQMTTGKFWKSHEESTGRLRAGAVGSSATFESTGPTNWMKKKMITGTGYEKTDTGGTNGSGEKG